MPWIGFFGILRAYDRLACQAIKRERKREMEFAIFFPLELHAEDIHFVDFISPDLRPYNMAKLQ